MSLLKLYAALAGSGGGGVVAFTGDDYTHSDSTTDPSDATCELEIQADGEVFIFRESGSDAATGTWYVGTIAIADYDFRLDQITGSLNAVGTDLANTWIAGSAIPRWGVEEETADSSHVFTGTLRVRPSGGGADIDTAAVSLTAFVSP